MHSHHSHSGQFCRHAKDDLEQVVSRAVELGFKTYGLSEHAPRYREEDLFPEEVGRHQSFNPGKSLMMMQADLEPSDLALIYDDFLKTATRLQEHYRDRIRLLVGLETDFITPLDLERTKALLEARREVQYVVGSVHHVAGVSIDFDQTTYLRSIEHCTHGTVGSTMVRRGSSSTTPGLVMPSPLDPDATPTDEQLSVFLEQYLDAQYEMIQQLEPEVIGHFDLCLLFNPGYSLQRPGVWSKVERNIKRVIVYGGLFEANGAAIRKGWDTSYPSRQVLKACPSCTPPPFNIPADTAYTVYTRHGRTDLLIG